MANILFEILSEEIPFSLQKQAEIDIKNLWQQALLKDNIKYQEINILSTPRRLVSHIIGLDDVLTDVTEEKKGPSTKAPEAAIQGFLKSNGVTLSDCEIKATNKGDFYYLNTVKKGGELKDFLPSLIIDEILSKMKFAKSMRYNETNVFWARPIRNLLLMLEKQTSQKGGISTEVLEFSWGGLSSNNKTYTHRFLGKKEVKVTSIAEYFESLEKNMVILGAKQRKEMIAKSVEEIAQNNNCTVLYNDKLFEEIAYLVEYVDILVAKIPKEYMHLPRELMTNIIATNQRYINFLNLDGSLSEVFVIISNMQTKDNGHTIINGNKKVLEARLKDGLFFYNNDLSVSLINRVEELKKINFFEGLGSLFDKKERVKKLFITIFNEEQNLLCDIYKSDLSTSVVFEIPELQGIMGYYYAMQNGHDKNIAIAILQQYAPQGPNDATPSSVLGAKLALLDKLDTVVSLFSIGKKPNGSKDPFALRRAAIGIIRIIKDSNFNINLQEFLDNNVVEFLKERLIFFMKDKNYPINIIQGVVFDDKNCNILQIIEKIEVLTKFFETKMVQNIASSYKRVNNIMQSYGIALGKESEAINTKVVNFDLLLDITEKQLYEVALQTNDNITRLNQEALPHDKALDIILEELTKLSIKLNVFLDTIIINQSESEEVKKNRLQLLMIVVKIYNSGLPLRSITA